MKHGIALVCLGWCLAGCVEFQYDGTVYPKRDNRVLVFQVDHPPQAAYWEKIGTATISRNARYYDPELLIDDLRAEAAARGADAIYLTHEELTKENRWLYQADFLREVREIAPEPAVAAPAPAPEVKPQAAPTPQPQVQAPEATPTPQPQPQEQAQTEAATVAPLTRVPPLADSKPQGSSWPPWPPLTAPPKASPPQPRPTTDPWPPRSAMPPNSDLNPRSLLYPVHQ